VRRRDGDAGRVARLVGAAVEVAALIPEGQPALLCLARVVLLGEFGRHFKPRNHHETHEIHEKMQWLFFFLFVYFVCFVVYFSSSLNSLYSIESTNACQLASMMFSLTPTVPQTSLLSRDSMTTRTRAAVPALALTTRTL